MDDEILEGEVIEPGMGRVGNQQMSADFNELYEKDLHPFLKSLARDFEQRLNLLTDYQQAVLQIMPEKEIGKPAVSSETSFPVLRQMIGAWGETLVYIGTRLLTSTDLEEDAPAVTEKKPFSLPFSRPFVFCYQDEEGEDESTE